MHVHMYINVDRIFEFKYTNYINYLLEVKKCSSKLNNLFVALLEKNLAGGNPLPRFFSSHPKFWRQQSRPCAPTKTYRNQSRSHWDIALLRITAHAQ